MSSIFTKMIGLVFCLVFAFLLVPQLVFAGEMCPICDGQVGKQRCLDNSCRTSCYPIGIMCSASEGHCANGACSKNCCAGQALAEGQTCTNDTISGEPIWEGGKTTICLDPGHVTVADNIQPPKNGISENENAFNTAKAVKKILEGDGYKVVMTKESADATKTPDGKRLENQGGCTDEEGIRNRSEYCKAAGANYMFSIHSDTAGDGPYIIAPPRPASGCTPNTTKAYFERNYDYAKKIQATIASVLGSSHDVNPNGVVLEGNGYTRCNPSNPNCWQLNATAAAIKEELDKGLIEMTPDPPWFKENIGLVSEAIAKGIASAIPKNIGGGSCAEMGKKVVEVARSQIKKTYVWGGCHVEPSNYPDGCEHYDCTGLTGWSWWKGSGGKVNFHGATLTGGQYEGSNITYVKPGQDVAEGAQPGDIIGWSNTSSWKDTYHGAIYSGNNKLIEAYSSGNPSRETSITGRRPLYFARPKDCK